MAPGGDLVTRFPCAEGACGGCLRRRSRSPWPPYQRLQREPQPHHHSAKLRHSGANPSKREAKGHAAALRALGHTHISAAVLQAALRDFREAHPPDEERAALEEAWAVVDADGDGAVRGEEVHAMLDLVLTQGEPLTAEETAAFWAEVDTDADGEVTKAEFMRMLAADGGGEAKGGSEGGGDAARNEHASL